MSGLPKGWEWARFSDVARVASNLVDPAEFARFPHIAPNHIESSTGKLLQYQTVAEDGVTSPKHLFRPGQILYSKIRPYLAKVATVEFAGLCSADMYPIDTGLNYRFLKWWMLTPRFTEEAIKHQGRSVLPKINVEALSMLPIPVPPLAEQRRIVAALDAYLSRLDAGLSDVDAARRRGGSLWQSILSREIFHGNAWPITTLGQLSHGSSYGTSVKCSYTGQGAAVVRIPNVIDGRIDVTDMKFAADSAVDLSSLYLSSGDILFVRTNGSRSLIGRTAVVDKLATGIAFASYLIRFRLHAEIVRPRWIHYVLESPLWRRRLEQEAASSAGQYNLSVAKLERIPIPLPMLGEQDSILAELDNQCSAHDRLESSLEVAAAHGETLRRSLLTAAFSGRLVLQDSSDESASVLLERIRAEPRPKRGRRVAKNVDQGSLM